MTHVTLTTHVRKALSSQTPRTLFDLKQRQPELRWIPGRTLRSILADMLQRGEIVVDASNPDQPTFCLVDDRASTGGGR